MKTCVRQSKLGVGTWLAILLSGCAVSNNGPIGSGSPLGNAAEQSALPVGKTEGVIVHIDPKTGEVIAPPTGVLPGQVAQPEAAKLASELKESQSPIPGGGVMIELDDRFRSPLTATIDADGKLRFEHKANVAEDNK
jgi:hypothetical protein